MAEGVKTRFAVIGCGHIGKRHVQVLGAGDDFELVAVCDIDTDARNIQGIPSFASIEELISSGPAFDVATIATPNGLHGAHAMALLKEGRHVVIEKPMALTTEDCQRILS